METELSVREVVNLKEILVNSHWFFTYIICSYAVCIVWMRYGENESTKVNPREKVREAWDAKNVGFEARVWATVLFSYSAGFCAAISHEALLYNVQFAPFALLVRKRTRNMKRSSIRVCARYNKIIIALSPGPHPRRKSVFVSAWSTTPRSTLYLRTGTRNIIYHVTNLQFTFWKNVI